MAGKIRLAAKCLLGTTLLASGSGGVYYATTHGWSLPGAGQTVKRSSTELDAVAGAWTEPATKRAQDAANSSPVARSADAAPAHDAKPMTKPADVDRYAMPVKTPTPVVVVKEDKAKDKEVAQEEQKKEEPAPVKTDDAAAQNWRRTPKTKKPTGKMTAHLRRPPCLPLKRQSPAARSRRMIHRRLLCK